MTFDTAFSLANMLAMAGWACLIFLPRLPVLLTVLRTGLVGGLSIAYTVLIMVFFFRIEGAGFGSIGEVRALFMSDAGLLAGWIHYLAFDMFIGLWIASEADKIRMSRVLQAPMLAATFMFGPIGLLLFLVSRRIRTTSILTSGA